jgi:hypothetical protein
MLTKSAAVTAAPNLRLDTLTIVTFSQLARGRTKVKQKNELMRDVAAFAGTVVLQEDRHHGEARSDPSL